MDKINIYYTKQDCPQDTPKDWSSMINEDICLVSLRISGVMRYIISPTLEVGELRMALLDLYNIGVIHGLLENEEGE